MRQGILGALFIAVVATLGLSSCKARKEFGGSLVYNESSTSALTYTQQAAQLMASSDLLLSYSASNVTQSGGYISKLINSKTTVAAPAGTFDLTPDVASLATLTTFLGGSRLVLISPTSGIKQFQSPPANGISLSEMTVIFVGDFSIGTKVNNTSNLISLSPDGTQSSSFYLYRFSSPSLQLLYTAGAANYSITLADDNDYAFIAATWTNDINSSYISNQGNYATGPVMTGSPAPPIEMNRYLSLGFVGGPQNLGVAELHVFKRALTPKEAGAIIATLRDRYSPNNAFFKLAPAMKPVGTTAQFAGAQAILQSKCANCHSDFSGASEEYYLSAGYVGSTPETSKMYYRLKGSTGAGGPKDMPKSGTQLTPDELNIIYTWLYYAGG